MCNVWWPSIVTIAAAHPLPRTAASSVIPCWWQPDYSYSTAGPAVSDKCSVSCPPPVPVLLAASPLHAGPINLEKWRKAAGGGVVLLPLLAC